MTYRVELFFIVLAVTVLATAHYFTRPVPYVSGKVETQIHIIGSQLVAALASKSKFDHTSHGYEMAAEAPQAPAGLKQAELQAWMAMAQRHPVARPLSLTFPEHYSDGTEVRGEGIAVRIKPLGSNAAPIQIEDGKLVYHDAYASTDSLQVVSEARSEEFLLLHDARAPQRFNYDIAVTSGVKDFSLKDDTIHLKNAQGRQLQIEAPWLVEAGGKRVPNAVHWELSYPKGQSQPRLTLVVSNAGQLHYPVVIDPTWVATSSVMNSPRTGHSMTLLNNGKVLVAGGANTVGTPIASSEIYDPATGIWTPTGSLNEARFDHTATLLSNGEVLVSGGVGTGSGTTSAELYDPATGIWTTTGSLHDRRFVHTATLLPDGDVLVVGGYESGPVLSSAELYHPATGIWTVTGSLNVGRYSHTSTLLPNGQVLVTGGLGVSAGVQTIPASTELYNPAAGTWTTTGSMHAGRYYHEATLLNTGNVLVSGGMVNYGVGTTGSELYNPANGTWTQAGSMATARDKHTATLLPTGQVLVAGGEYANQPINQYATLATTEIYNPGTGTWSSAANLTVPHSYHTTTLLANGQLLVAGGFAPVYSSDISEIYDPSKASFSATVSLNAARYSHTATLLPNGLVLVAGGALSNNSYLASAELYDPVAVTWTTTGNLNTARANHTATLLPSGRVLVSGGQGGLGTLTSAELYDSTSGTWAATGSLQTARYLHTATLLQNGEVLVAGGKGNSGPSTSAELYDPTSGTWTATGDLNTARQQHTGTLLPNGQVLVAGGFITNPGLLTSTELYDAASGTWTATGNLNSPRFGHTATLLPEGQVLVAGGSIPGSSTFEISAELYDPVTMSWTATGNLNTARGGQGATLLADGQVLLAGGGNGTFPNLASAELYDPALGTWTLAGNLGTGRKVHTATLLPNGRVLIAGGSGTSNAALRSAEIFDSGLGYGGATQPQLNTVSTISAGSALIMTGTKFTGISEGSGGSKNNSASNIPVVQLKSLANEQTVNLSLNPGQGFTATSFSSLSPAGLPPGHAMLTMFVNGTPSRSQIVNYTNPAVQSLNYSSPQTLGLGGSPYYLPATTSAGLAVTYSVVSGPAAVSEHTLMLTGTGSVVLQADQAGNTSYAPFSTMLMITVANSMALSEWEAQPGFFNASQRADPAISGPGATLKSDGAPNLLKYLCNINPAVPMSTTDRYALPVSGSDTTTMPGTTYLTLTYRQYALVTGLVVEVQTSPDCQTWTSVTPDITKQTFDSNTGDPVTEVEVNTNGASREFIRLHVSMP